jgi:hypothetical protein
MYALYPLLLVEVKHRHMQQAQSASGAACCITWQMCTYFVWSDPVLHLPSERTFHESLLHLAGGHLGGGSRGGRRTPSPRPACVHGGSSPSPAGRAGSAENVARPRYMTTSRCASAAAHAGWPCATTPMHSSAGCSCRSLPAIARSKHGFGIPQAGLRAGGAGSRIPQPLISLTSPQAPIASVVGCSRSVATSYSWSVFVPFWYLPAWKSNAAEPCQAHNLGTNMLLPPVR